MDGRKLIAKALDLDEKFALLYPKLAKTERERQARQIIALYLDGAEQLKATSKTPEVQKTIQMVDGRVERLFKMVTNSRCPPTKTKSKPTPKGLDSALAERIMNEIVDESKGVAWDDIVGQEDAKRALKESILLPFQRPDLFTGVRRPAKGILLFGPPGTGKTLLAKAVASASPNLNCTFFALSASSLVSKWVGESEKLIKTLFSLARHLQPSIIFIDEIDSLLQARGDGEQEAMRRLKTEFLLQFDGLSEQENEQLVVIGATNRPGDLDEAARRRFTKRILVTLPELEARLALLKRLLGSVRCSLTARDYEKIARQTEGFSAADLAALASEISLQPLREIDSEKLLQSDASAIRPIKMADVNQVLSRTKSSIDPKSVKDCLLWNNQFGST